MRLIRDLFADKYIRMQEGSNIIIHMLLKIDFLKQYMKEAPYSAKDNPLKITLEVLVQIAMFVWAFIGRNVSAHSASAGAYDNIYIFHSVDVMRNDNQYDNIYNDINRYVSA